MAKSLKDQKKPERPEIELEPDAWPRFERFVKAIAKAGPQHRVIPKLKERPASKGRVRKGKSRA
jgi:hypothetical protein